MHCVLWREHSPPPVTQWLPCSLGGARSLEAWPNNNKAAAGLCPAAALFISSDCKCLHDFQHQ